MNATSTRFHYVSEPKLSRIAVKAHTRLGYQTIGSLRRLPGRTLATQWSVYSLFDSYLGDFNRRLDAANAALTFYNDWWDKH